MPPGLSKVYPLLCCPSALCQRLFYEHTICSKIGFDKWTRIEALGFSGGIWLFWSERLDISIIKTHPQFMHVQIKKNGNCRWLLIVVYASPTPSLRKILWKELNQQMLPLSDPWLVVGISTPPVMLQKPPTRGYKPEQICRFNNWISEHGVIDLGFSGPPLHGPKGIPMQLSKVLVLIGPFAMQSGNTASPMQR